MKFRKLLRRMAKSVHVWEIIRMAGLITAIAAMVRLIQLGDGPLRWERALVLIGLILALTGAGIASGEARKAWDARYRGE